MSTLARLYLVLFIIGITLSKSPKTPGQFLFIFFKWLLFPVVFIYVIYLIYSIRYNLKWLSNKWFGLTLNQYRKFMLNDVE
jgi:hypothetical protein